LTAGDTFDPMLISISLRSLKLNKGFPNLVTVRDPDVILLFSIVPSKKQLSPEVVQVSYFTAAFLIEESSFAVKENLD
jgi:hypothetical protein